MKIWILLFLIMAAIYDYRDFKIPNKLNGAGALITLVLAWRWRCEAADGMCNIYRTGNASVSDFVIYM